MKVSLISNEINLPMLNNEINYYLNLANQEPYLFMNKDTANTIAEQHGLPSLVVVKDYSKNVGTYVGYKIYLDDDLKFGEVDIR
jgi:hypothetical protein